MRLRVLLLANFALLNLSSCSSYMNQRLIKKAMEQDSVKKKDETLTATKVNKSGFIRYKNRITPVGNPDIKKNQYTQKSDNTEINKKNRKPLNTRNQSTRLDIQNLLQLQDADKEAKRMLAQSNSNVSENITKYKEQLINDLTRSQKHKTTAYKEADKINQNSTILDHISRNESVKRSDETNYVQIIVHSSISNVQGIQIKLQTLYGIKTLITLKNNQYVLSSVPYSSRDKAIAIKKKVIQAGYKDSFITKKI